MAALSPDIVALLTIIIASLVTLLAYYFVLAKFFIGKPNIIAPNVPSSEEGQAKSGAEWFKAGWTASAKKMYRNGGLDVEIGVLRARMLCHLFCWLMPVCFGVALAYAILGVTEAGTARLGMSNLLAKDFAKGRSEEEAQKRMIWYLAQRMWIATVGTYVSQLFSLHFCDRYDEQIVAMVERSATRAPAHHYAVLVTDLGPTDSDETVRDFFDACLGGAGAVRRIVPLSNLDHDVVEPREDDEEPTLVKKILLGAAGPPASVRGAVNKWAESLAAQERAEFFAQEEVEDPEGSKAHLTLAEATAASADARERSEAARVALAKRDADAAAAVEAARKLEETEGPKRRRSSMLSMLGGSGKGDDEEEDPPEPPKTLVVVFDTLARCSVALSAQLRNAGATDGWKIVPLPEPRDLRWATLENYPDKLTRKVKGRTARTLKIYLIVVWSLVLAALGIAIVAVAEEAEKLSAAFAGLAAAAASFVGSSLAATMLRAMAGILAVINDLFETHISESSLQRSVSTDYATFAIVAGFLTPLIGTTLYSAFSDMGGNPFAFVSFIAQQVPTNAFTIMLTILKLMFYPPNAACRLDDEITRRALAYVFMTPTPVTEREKVIEPGPLLLFDMCGLDTFIFTIGLTYAPIQPVATFLCMLYYALGVLPRKFQPQVYRISFDTDGTFQKIYASQHINCILFALCLQFFVIVLSGSYFQGLAMIPLFFVWCHYYGKFTKRHQNSLHGASHSRLALEDAARIDKERAAGVAAWEAGLDEKGYWRAPEAVPPTLKIEADAPAKDQLDALQGWLERHCEHSAGDWKTAAASPRAETEKKAVV
mmetsp:Transcript_36426/g.112691  ORF Transcript_36426/g.112691 Transcript_36426/m.112691 type:complete len:825 (-) Transcript_36426:82-2556(-)